MSYLTAGSDIPFVGNCCWRKNIPSVLVFSIADDVPLNVAMLGDPDAVRVLLAVPQAALTSEATRPVWAKLEQSGVLHLFDLFLISEGIWK